MTLGTIAVMALAFAAPLRAQRPTAPNPAVPAAATAERDTAARFTPIPSETSSVTDHAIRVGSQLVPYRAMAGTMVLQKDKDGSIGVLYYTASTRRDAENAGHRPPAFLFNGGPGAAPPLPH